MEINEYTTEVNRHNRLTNLVLKRVTNYYTIDRTLSAPETIVSMMNMSYHMDTKAEEYCYMLSVDTKCHPIGLFEISHGNCNSALVGAREIFVRALLSGAVHLIFIHNHPSGIADPSHEDDELCRRLQKGADLLGLKVLDFIVVGDHQYFSFMEENRI